MSKQVFGYTPPGMQPPYIAATDNEDGTHTITVRNESMVQANITIPSEEAAKLSEALAPVNA